MRKVIFAINMTLDGHFGHEGVIADDELHQYFAELMRSAGLVLFGRITYQMMFPYWHTVAENQSDTPEVNEFARTFDSLEKIVFSQTLQDVDSLNTTISRAKIEDELPKLKNQPGGDIYIDGLSVAAHLTRLGLIDEYYIVVHPLIAGNGPRLFEGDGPAEPLRLELVDTKTLGSGAIALHYRKAQ